jgi:hypothetical protein
LSLPPASRQDVETALAAVRETLNFIESHYLNKPVRNEYGIEGLGGVEPLLAHLRKSLGISRRRPHQPSFLGRSEPAGEP